MAAVALPTCPAPCRPALPAVFAPSNAAFSSALLNGRLWRQLLSNASAAAPAGAGADGSQSSAPQAAAIRELLLDHLAAGARLTLADLRQLAASNGSVVLASGRRAAVVDRGGERAAGGCETLWRLLCGSQMCLPVQACPWPSFAQVR